MRCSRCGEPLNSLHIVDGCPNRPSDYTPTTEVVRHAVTFPRERLGEPRPIKPEAFDRWLSRVRFEAWEEGRRAGLRQSDEDSE